MITADTRLGQRMHSAIFAVVGELPDEVWFLRNLAERIGMQPEGDAMVRTFPTPDGRGGFGRMVVQPMTESFLAFDGYSQVGGGYLIVHSCKWFDHHAVEQAIAALDEYVQVVDRARSSIGLNDADEL